MLAAESKELRALSARPQGGPRSLKGNVFRRAHARVSWIPYWLLLPSVVVMGVLLCYPVVRLIETSFQQYSLAQVFSHKTIWNGIANYRAIFESASFWDSLLRTLLFTVACVGLKMIIGMVVALMMVRISPVIRTITSVVMIGVWAMPPISAALVWQWLFANQFGVVDWVLSSPLHIGQTANFDWFGTNAFRAWSVITMMILWNSIPFVALCLYAGLSQVPTELYEAATVDGAGGWSTLREITIPVLRPIIGLVMVLSFIWDFNLFTGIWVLTQGGPNGGTETIGIWSYIEAFAANQYGLGAAAAVVSVVIVGLLSFYYVRNLIRAGEIQ